MTPCSTPELALFTSRPHLILFASFTLPLTSFLFFFHGRDFELVVPSVLPFIEDYFHTVLWYQGFPRGSIVKNVPANSGDPGLIPGSGRSPEKEMVTHFGILAWEIPWRGEPWAL